MRKVDDLVLLTTQNISLIYGEQEILIVQPTINDIAAVGEDKFFQALSLFTLSPEPMKEFIREIEDIEEGVRQEWIERVTLYDYLLFLMSAVKSSASEIGVRELLSTVFSLIVPSYKFHVAESSGEMFFEPLYEGDSAIKIGQDLFLQLNSIIHQMFVLEHFFQIKQSVELSKAAQEIADKMAASEEKITQMQGESRSGSYLARLLSIMGMYKDLNYLADLTIYQLHNQFERFNLHTEHKQSIQASLAGATGVKPVDWYKTI